jgi:hypothetical protein
MLGIAEKQPVEVLDYDIDFERWLVDDQITSAEAAVTPTGSLTVQTIDVDPALVKVWLAGGTTGITYKVEVTVETTGGRTGQVEFKVRVRDK